MMSFLNDNLKGVALSDQEKAKLSDAYAVYQSARGEFEAAIARVNRENDALTITIPPYESAGKHLQDLLFKAVEDTVGNDRGHSIAEQLGGQLETQFRGWGRDTQFIHVTFEGTTNNGDELFKVARSQVSAAPRDFSGGGDAKLKSLSATYTLAKSQLDAGELAPYSQYFDQLKPKE